MKTAKVNLANYLQEGEPGELSANNPPKIRMQLIFLITLPMLMVTLSLILQPVAMRKLWQSHLMVTC